MGYLISDLGDKSWLIIRSEREREAKVRDDFLYEKLLALKQFLISKVKPQFTLKKCPLE